MERKKKQVVLKKPAIVIAVAALIFSVSFTARRIEEYKEKISVVSGEVVYKETDTPKEEKKYEQVISESKKIEVPQKKIEEEKRYQLPAEGEIILGFNSEEVVYLEETGDYRTHNGIDIETNGKGVYAVCDGEVKDVYTDVNNNYVVVTEHKDFVSVYKNMNIGPDLKPGVVLKKGDLIGEGISGENGNKFIHYEAVKDGIVVNPEEIFK